MDIYLVAMILGLGAMAIQFLIIWIYRHEIAIFLEVILDEFEKRINKK